MINIGIIPIIVVALLAITEVVLSLRLNGLPAISVEELNDAQPKLKTIAFLARTIPTILFGLGILIIVARVGRRLSVDLAVLIMLALIMFWALTSALFEMNYGLTYRLVRRRRLPGEMTAIKPEQYRLGPEVVRNGRYRIGVWFIALIFIIVMFML